MGGNSTMIWFNFAVLHACEHFNIHFPFWGELRCSSMLQGVHILESQGSKNVSGKWQIGQGKIDLGPLFNY